MRPVARAFVGVLVGVMAGACGAARPANTASTPLRRPEAGAKCGGCHATQSAEWDESMHHASFSSPDFQASYREEPLPFCVGCHAPRKADLGMAEGAARGIDCASCHPHADEHDRAARVSHAAARDTAPHEVRDCATCHELTSPGSGTFLQSTASEHRASRAHEIPCASCHMPEHERGKHDHRFRVSRDARFLSHAIALRDVRREPEGVVLTLASVGVGHCYPTGDIFRELFVRAWIETEDGHVVGDVEVALHRDWDAHRRAFGKEDAPIEVGDTRLCNEDRLVRIPGPMAQRVPLVVRVAVDYRRGFEARGGNLAVFASLRIADWQRSLPAENP